ncbi:hypothetical protein ABT247_19525 [Kitasatospora sp. NPDC001539]|uniref:hypothetical protein n=1 Tax=Kitasatospora sp. NPDC001539 TaxID=3154384 RepID=UPI0033254197
MEDTGPPPEGPPADDTDAFDLCDECGRVVAAAELLGALVPDSSALHPTDSDLDGKRVLTACSVDHLAVLVEHYRQRPFVPEEQWAGKVCRALADCDQPMPLSVVARLSGLSEHQAEQGVEWHNARAREWQARYGGPAGADGDENEGD